MYEDLAPAIRIEVEGVEVPSAILDATLSVEFELAEDMSDLLTWTLVNPGNQIIDKDIIQPGHRVDIYTGYGTVTEHIGSAILTKFLPNFPQDGNAKVTVKGYDKSFDLMDTSEERKWEAEVTYDAIATEIGLNHGLDVSDVQPVESSNSVVQKSGMSDYKLLRGLANIIGYDFYIDFDSTTKLWKLHFKPFQTTQEKIYTFDYSNGTLKYFEPEYALRQSITELNVYYFDKTLKEWIEIVVEETATGEVATFTGSKNMEQEITSSTALRIAAAGKSVEVVRSKPFASANEAITFANAWFQKKKDSFLLGTGEIVGLETLKPRQEHTINGLGNRFSGSYYFYNVTHRFIRGNSSNVYATGFKCRKVIL